MKVVDLFAGGGGLSQGMQQAGLTVSLAVEKDASALGVYRANHDHPAMDFDLSDVAGAVALIAPYGPDVIVGGPPCQDFSSAGKRQEDVRADLTVAFAEIVAGVQPMFFVMENVPLVEASKSFAKATDILRDAGYSFHGGCFNAAKYGSPQRRRRFLLVGSLDASAASVAFESLVGAASEKEMTLRQAFPDFPEHYYRHPRSYARRGVFSIDEPSPTIRGVNRPQPATYQPHPNDAKHAPVPALTTRQRALIQGFGPGFRLDGRKTVDEQVVGNAVPVPLARALGRSLLVGLESLRRTVVKEAKE